MKIMTLNIHRFSGTGRRDDTEGLSFNQCPKAKEILEAVDRFLSEGTENIVFLEEMPYMYKTGRDGAVRELYTEFEKELAERKYKIIPQEQNAHSSTIAIVHEESAWSPEPRSTFMAEYRNRFVTVRHGGTDLLVLGLHAIHEGKPPYSGYPTEEVKAFFERLRTYAHEHVEGKTVILGDMNVHSEKPCDYYDIFHSIRTAPGAGGLGYADLVKDGEITHFPTGHTLDHVLVSPALKDSGATARVYKQSELELSDHAVIVVDIQV